MHLLLPQSGITRKIRIIIYKAIGLSLLDNVSDIKWKENRIIQSSALLIGTGWLKSGWYSILNSFCESKKLSQFKACSSFRTKLEINHSMLPTRFVRTKAKISPCFTTCKQQIFKILKKIFWKPIPSTKRS